MDLVNEISHKDPADSPESGHNDIDYLESSEVDFDVEVDNEAVVDDYNVYNYRSSESMHKPGVRADERAKPINARAIDNREVEREHGVKAGAGIGISEELMQRIPDDFKFNEIGKIDLIEAEQIANENILIITEKELIDDLEDLHELELNYEGIEEIDEYEEMKAAKARAVIKEAEEKIATELPEKEATEKIELKCEDEKNKNDEDRKERENKSAAIEEKDKTEIKEETGAIIKETAPEEQNEVSTDVFPSEEDFTGQERTDKTEVEEEVSASEPVITASEMHAVEIDVIDDHGTEYANEEIQKEVLALSLLSVGESDPHVLFLDDDFVEKPKIESLSIFEESRLDKIIADMAEIDIGHGITIKEADWEDEKERFSPLSMNLPDLQDDFTVEFIDDNKYRDPELEFIYSSIIEEDYSTYLREIDEFQGTKGKRGVTRAVELFGLTPNDFESVEGKLFGEEYKNIDLYEIFDFFTDSIVKRGTGIPTVKVCTYIVADPESLSRSDRDSIEEDISSANALVYEESVNDIRELLIRAEEDEKPESVSVVETIVDITDKVVIIEDEEDIDRFLKDFPQNKQSSMKRLLKYLDGLFEKLPEVTIKNFADSEYYDLYMKVLNDLGE